MRLSNRKKKTSQAATKRSIYHNFQFLLLSEKMLPLTICSMEHQLSAESRDETQSGTGRDTRSETVVDTISEAGLDTRDTPNTGTQCAHRTRREKNRLQEDVDREILKTLKTSATPDEDEAFFISVLCPQYVGRQEVGISEGCAAADT